MTSIRNALRTRLAPQIAAALILTSLAACAPKGECCDDASTSAEVAITRDQLPTKVAATLNRELANGSIGEIEKEIKDGQTVYSFDVMIDGKAYDLAIAEDGTLIEKELETNESEGK